MTNPGTPLPQSPATKHASAIHSAIVSVASAYGAALELMQFETMQQAAKVTALVQAKQQVEGRVREFEEARDAATKTLGEHAREVEYLTEKVHELEDQLLKVTNDRADVFSRLLKFQTVAERFQAEHQLGRLSAEAWIELRELLNPSDHVDF